MSIAVDLDGLEQALADFGAGYLLTTAGDGRVKAVTVEPACVDGILLVGPSKGSASNLSTNPTATVLFPPRKAQGYSLIVDGTAAATDAGIAVTPQSAVLHRPASHSDGPPPPTGCQNDCTRL